MRRATGDSALALMPASLPLVEPELRATPPRAVALVTRDGSPLGPESSRAVREWRAIKGWIVSVDQVADHEGPDYHIVVAWHEPDLRVEKTVIGYDSYHWALSYPEHFAWFHARIQPGQPVTVLASPRGKQWWLYGQCEPFVVRGDLRVFAAD